MKQKIELLAPGGNIDSIKAAIVAGADAIYCGLNRFNARNRAENITFEDLHGILRLAHKNNCEVFLTLNIIILEHEIFAFIDLLNKLINTQIDGIIVQDLGMLYLLKKHFPTLKVHASTQLTTHNKGQIKFLKALNVTRVNLSRELSLDEIKPLTSIAHRNNVLIEVFVHGAYCISFSGVCYFSSVQTGNSGNRGRCSQPCRDQYLTTAQGKAYPLNLKDNSAYHELQELAEAGVDSLKIEGRIKGFHYVYTVVKAWKKQLASFFNHNKLLHDNTDIYKVFNRDFSNSFLTGKIDKNMFIDNSRNNAALHLAKMNGGCTNENLENAKRKLYDLRTKMISNIRSKIDCLSIAKLPLELSISGKSNTILKVSVKTPDNSFCVLSDTLLAENDRQSKAPNLDKETLLKKFKALNETEYFIQHIKLENLQEGLFIPFKELTSIKNKILFILNNSKETVDPVCLPKLSNKSAAISKPELSLLISSKKDLYLTDVLQQFSRTVCREEANVYFQLPDSLKNKLPKLIALFSQNNIVPWFPSIIIGEDYNAAIEFLHQVQPKRIVTNNTGIAYEANQMGIPWIAGPYLNIVNSFSLLCLKENFNCYGSFISNELNKNQIRNIRKPADFRLYYSIYHPIQLLTSRQCLFHQVTGCVKDQIDDMCIQECEKTSSITNLNKASFVLSKTKGCYHTIYNETNFLNTNIATDIPNFFSSFLIDLRDIRTNTKIGKNKSELIKLFSDHLNGNSASAQKLRQALHPSIATQYQKGL